MANVSIYDADFSALWNFGFDDFCEESLLEVAPIVENKMKSIARSTIQHEGDSEMVNSIKCSKVWGKYGSYGVNIGPRGYSSTKVYKNKKEQRVSVSNALKAIWKEYGIPSRGISPRPFISQTVAQCENQVQQLLQRKFEERIEE